MSTFDVEQHAMTFAWLAQETIHRFGADGEKTILEGIRRYGERRGGRMAARARADGRPNDVSGYLLYGELRFGETDNEFQVVQKTPYLEVHTKQCAWHSTWSKRGMLEYGRLYCQEIDCAIIRGFNPGFRFEVDGTLTNGAPYCRFLYYDGRLGPLDMLRYLWRKRRLGDRATRPWDYHVADLYKALSETLIQRFGDAGRQAVDAVMDAFAGEYGTEAADTVRKSDQNTDSLD